MEDEGAATLGDYVGELDGRGSRQPRAGLCNLAVASSSGRRGQNEGDGAGVSPALTALLVGIHAGEAPVCTMAHVGGSKR